VKEVQGNDTAENGSTYRLNGDKSTHRRYSYWRTHLFYITSLLVYILGVFNTFGFFRYAIFDIVLLYPPFVAYARHSLKNNHLASSPIPSLSPLLKSDPIPSLYV